jgi:hypothetical protein
MRPCSRPAHLASLAPVVVLLAWGQASAQLVPVSDERSILAKSGIPGHVGMHGVGYSSDDFGHFEQSTSSLSEAYGPCSPGSPEQCVVATSDAYAALNSDFFETAISFDGHTSGQWSGQYTGAYELQSITRFRFRIDTPVDYELTASVLPGNWETIGRIGCFVELQGPIPDISVHYTQFGFLEASGRLGPGEYVIQGVSSGAAGLEYMDGGTYFGQLLVNAVTDTIIVGQPLDSDVICGDTATFSVTPSPSAGSVTYQWMRNLAPLGNSTRIAGATTNTLTISNACDADTGYYSVLVTVAGTVPPNSAPSRLAHLGIVSVTGVQEDPLSSGRNAVPNRARIRAAVYDVRGARVRDLGDIVTTGSGTVTWDGRTQGGSTAPAGIYFVQVEAGSTRRTTKVVLLK